MIIISSWCVIVTMVVMQWCILCTIAIGYSKCLTLWMRGGAYQTTLSLPAFALSPSPLSLDWLILWQLAAMHRQTERWRGQKKRMERKSHKIWLGWQKHSSLGNVTYTALFSNQWRRVSGAGWLRLQPDNRPLLSQTSRRNKIKNKNKNTFWFIPKVVQRSEHSYWRVLR